MTTWMPDLSTAKGPRYAALLEAIDRATRSGELMPGDRLPPQRDLAWKLGVTVGTVGRAYALAEQRKLVSGQVGRGTYVLAPPPPEEATIASAPGKGDETMNLTRNTAPMVGQAEALSETLRELSRAPGGAALLGYMPEAGHVAYRRAGARWMARAGLDVPEQRVIVTGGAQHALAIAQVSLLRQGDAVLIEHLTYNGVGNAMRLVGAHPVGVAMDDEGALPEDLDRLARETGARLACLTPSVHSPTTATMSLERRRAVAEVLRRRDLILIEDDVYGYLAADRPPPIASFAPERVIYVTSASKCMAPGLRVAWMAAPSGLVARLGDTLHAMALALPAFSAEIATRWINDGTAERIVAKINAAMVRRHAAAAQAFQGLDWRTRADALHGFITLRDGHAAGDLVDEAARRGILLCAAPAFAVDAATAPNAFRVTLGSVNDLAALQRTLATIAGLARGPAPADAETLRRRIV